MTKDQLYISAYQKSPTVYVVNIETYVILSIFNIEETEVNLLVVLQNEPPMDPNLTINFSTLKYSFTSDIPEVALFAVWPVIVARQQIIAGLCSVARSLIRTAKKLDLLGFREACLMACSESSIWTRFCEIDIIQTTKTIVNNGYYENAKFSLPVDLAKFEYHLSRPVRIHNVYKVAREKNNKKDIKSSVPVEDLNLEHTFSEGPFMTLADVILYHCFRVIFATAPKNISDKIPLSVQWYNQMKTQCLPELETELLQGQECLDIVEPSFTKESLYTSDPSRYRPEKRIYTKQSEIESSLKQLSHIKNLITNSLVPYGEEVEFDWSKIPVEANPVGGKLPEKRAARKFEQLENLAKAVVKLANGKKCRIVDFCSGSGHLGILVAYLLPACEIILVENKEQSLSRAKERMEILKLANITIVQSNLDYYKGKFDIGVALHACGVATDLVIQSCMHNMAHFVVCPCCYGGVKNCHHLSYPLSDDFKYLTYGSYLNFAHAADQTHDLDNVKTQQGYFCMDIVDTDRRLYSESCGYEVHLGKLQPTSCTNKNNLLVGIFKGVN
ncbi:unnamed protein product [Phaedon cochleariae]|uniref:Methyltransferase domain-containing protein n=1 Tax=Phaedon cochleariae TaxID=80249 RepID=A0A9P0DK68_PHACE|nr:unnamed protein product [Phaedon cochleariae]